MVGGKQSWCFRLATGMDALFHLRANIRAGANEIQRFHWLRRSGQLG